MYWYFENEDVGAFAVQADTPEQAQAIADENIETDPESDVVNINYGEISEEQVDLYGLDVY